MIQLENDIHLDYNPIQLDTIEIELENDMRAIEMTPAEIDLENDLKWDPDLRTFIDWTLCNWHVFSKVLDVTIFFLQNLTIFLPIHVNYVKTTNVKKKLDPSRNLSKPMSIKNCAFRKMFSNLDLIFKGNWDRSYELR